MKKVVYTMEQIIDLSRLINGLTVTGLENCKLIAAAAHIIDTPLSIDENSDDGENGDEENEQPET